MAPSSRVRVVRIRQPSQRKADSYKAETGKDSRDGGALVPPVGKSKPVSRRSCLFLCFSGTLVAAITILLPLAVFLHVHPQAVKARNGTLVFWGLPPGGSLSKEALARASDMVSTSLLLGTKIKDAAVLALDNRMLPKNHSAAASPPDLMIRPFRSSLDVLLASGAKIFPLKAGKKYQEPGSLVASRNSTAASVGVNRQNQTLPAAASTAAALQVSSNASQVPRNAALASSKSRPQRAEFQPPPPVVVLKPVGVAEDKKGKPKEAKGEKAAKQEKRDRKHKKENHSRKDRKKDKRKRGDRKQEEKEKKPAAKPVEEEKPAGKPLGEEKPEAKPVTGEKPAVKPVEEKEPPVKPTVEKKPAAKPAEEIKPAPKPAGEKKPAAKPAEEEKPEVKPVKGEKPAAKPGEEKKAEARPVKGEKPASKPGEEKKSEARPTGEKKPPSKPAEEKKPAEKNISSLNPKPMTTAGTTQSRKLLEFHQRGETVQRVPRQ